MEEHASLLRGQSVHAIRLQEANDSASRLESELADKSHSLEGLVERLKEAERDGREAQKRCKDQVCDTISICLSSTRRLGGTLTMISGNTDTHFYPLISE